MSNANHNFKKMVKDCKNCDTGVIYLDEGVEKCSNPDCRTNK